MYSSSSYFYPHSPHLIKRTHCDVLSLQKEDLRTRFIKQIGTCRLSARTKTEDMCHFGRTSKNFHYRREDKERQSVVSKKKEVAPRDSVLILTLLEKMKQLQGEEQ
jgi:hypothetical protein